MLPEAAGRGQHFQEDLGHSFLLSGPPSLQITYIYFNKKPLIQILNLCYELFSLKIYFKCLLVFMPNVH